MFGKPVPHIFSGCFCLLMIFMVSCVSIEEEVTATAVMEVVSTETAVATPIAAVPINITRQVISTPTPTMPATLLPTITSVSSPTATPIPLPLPPMQPFPTATPDYHIYDTKPIFLLYGGYGGDGGSDTDPFFGRDTPLLVIYADGQLLIRQGEWGERAFFEAQLTPNEMCALQQRIEATGFLEPHEEYYIQREGSDGAGSAIVQVEDTYYNFYAPDTQYLVADLANGLNLIRGYRPSTPLVTYIPSYLILWIEPIDLDDQDTPPTAWPTNLPSLAELWTDHSQPIFQVGDGLVEPIFSLFSHQLSEKIFQEGNETYVMIARPILPHETPRRFWVYPTPPKDYAPVLDCEGEPSLISYLDPTATPTLTADLTQLSGQGRILFVTDNDGDEEIFVMEANGTNRQRLTNNLADDFSPSWFPDGQHIVFASDRDGDSEIYVMAADGTNVVQLTDNDVGDYAPAVSPDGTQIAFVSDPNGDWEKSEIYTVHSDGSQLRRLTNDTKDDSNPEWTQDGLHILYKQPSGGALYPFRLNINTLESTSASDMILPSNSGNLRVWSPSGSRFVQDTEVDDINSAIQIMDSDGTTLREVTLPVDYFRSFDWSPDEKFVVFSAREYGDWDREIYVLVVETGEVIQVTHNQQDEFGAVWWP